MSTIPDTPRARWVALGALTLPVLLISMDNTILGFAIPVLSEELTPTSSQLLWIIDVYSFILAGLLVTMGVLGDRIGRRRLLLWGAAAFSAASLMAAFSTTAQGLIIARAALGVAGATLLPSTLSMIRNIFVDTNQRRMAIAVWSATFAVGGAIGPIVGGFMLEHFFWGSIFLLGVPITGSLLILGPRVLPESKDPDPGPVDVWSPLLSILAMLPLVYGLKRLAELAPAIEVIPPMTVGLVAGAAFVVRQRRLANPMLDLSLFAVPRVRMAVSGNMMACFAFAGSLYFVTQYLQLVAGLSPLRSGLALIPAVIASLASTLTAPVVAGRIGTFRVISVGSLIGAAGFVVLALADASGSVATAVVGVAVLNIGLGAAITVSVAGILEGIPPARAGAGASVSETANEFGIALGTAVLGSIIAFVYHRGLTGVTGIPEQIAARARETLGSAHRIAEELGGEMGALLVDAADTAFVQGMRSAALTTAVLLVMVAVWARTVHIRSTRTR